MIGGVGVEIYQSGVDKKTDPASAASAWGMEDLGSNNLGIVFGKQLNRKQPLSKQFREFCERPNHHATKPTEAPTTEASIHLTSHNVLIAVYPEIRRI
jgi:hypothetical protein